MWSYKITFKSLGDTLPFRVESENKQLIIDFVNGLFEIFGDIMTKKIDLLQKNDAETKNKINSFINTFEKRFPPTINQITAYFNRLEDNEYFFFLPNLELTIEESFKLRNYLVSLKEGVSFEKLNEDFDTTIGRTLKNYDLKTFGTIRLFIGNKNNRICRFCGKNRVETSFNNTAHAISEGLGNKKVFLYDECDKCNDKFSIEIEPDLINYFSIFRTFYNVKGKGGSKKIKGKNFEMSKGENVEIKFQSIDNRPDINKNPNEYNLKLDLIEKFNPQDIYRCLVKFCLSVVDEKQLGKFSETIRWINKELKIEKLPKVAELTSYEHFTTEPIIFLYIRKNNNKKIPYMVGEFRLTCKLLAFIIPLCDEDDKNFIDKIDFDNYWNEFPHFSKEKGWAFNDFSNDKEIELTFSLNMVK